MNRKLAWKLLLDAAMIVVMVILMGPGVTGLPWHEALGTVVLLLFIVHCTINAWWFRAAAKKRHEKRTFFYLFRQSVNTLLLVDSVLLFISSIMISHTVFAFLGLSSSPIWVYLHRVSAYTELILISVHLGLHWKMILGAFRKALQVKAETKALTMFWRICSLVLAVFGIWASITRDIAGKYCLPANTEETTKQSSETDGTTATAETERQTAALQQMSFQKNVAETERIFTDTPVQSGESEEDFLDRFTCTGCGKHCPLTSPRCGVGSTQAQQASVYYQNQTSEAATSSESSQPEASVSSSESNHQEQESPSSTVSTPQAESGTLEEYLGFLSCDGCSKHCPLSSPQCGVGQQKAQEVTTAYRAEHASSGAESGTKKVVTQESDSLPLLFRDYIPIMGMYAAGTYYLLEFVQERERKKAKAPK